MYLTKENISHTHMYNVIIFAIMKDTKIEKKD